MPPPHCFKEKRLLPLFTTCKWPRRKGRGEDKVLQNVKGNKEVKDALHLQRRRGHPHEFSTCPIDDAAAAAGEQVNAASCVDEKVSACQQAG